MDGAPTVGTVPSEPAGIEPDTAEPTAAEPTAAQPNAAQPNAAQPNAAPNRDDGPRRRYPWYDDPGYDPRAYQRTAPVPLPIVAAEPAPPAVEQQEADEPGTGAVSLAPSTIRMPRKLTVTRVAALRGRQLTGNSVRAFRRATSADGADRSGLAALTYATMMTYAVDAAVAVALANTLFFAAATAESKTNVALYLAITVAPFAVIAPVIGPLLDRLQRGRRVALAASFSGRAVLAVVLVFHYDTWLLYPVALGVMVLSKSFVVLKAAVTPRVLPPSITLVTTNSRLTMFGLASGAVFGAGAAGAAALTGSPGALLFTACCGIAGAVLCLRIPRWVESTAGEVPASMRTTSRDRRRPIGRGVLVALWGTGSVRVLTGFLTLFVAFAVKAQTEEEPTRQVLLLGIVGAAGGLGSFLGNAVGARRWLRGGGRSARAPRLPESVVLGCVGVAVAAAVGVALLPGIGAVAVAALIAGTCSALAKVSLDAVVQRDLPEESRASAFGRSETILQLAWVLGGALGVLLPHNGFLLGFAVVAVVVALGGLQTALVRRGRSVLPFLGPRADRVPA